MSLVEAPGRLGSHIPEDVAILAAGNRGVLCTPRWGPVYRQGRAERQGEPHGPDTDRRAGQSPRTQQGPGERSGHGHRRRRGIAGAKVRQEGDTTIMEIPTSFRRRGGRKQIILPLLVTGAPWAFGPRL